MPKVEKLETHRDESVTKVLDMLLEHKKSATELYDKVLEIANR